MCALKLSCRNPGCHIAWGTKCCMVFSFIYGFSVLTLSMSPFYRLEFYVSYRVSENLWSSALEYIMLLCYGNIYVSLCLSHVCVYASYEVVSKNRLQCRVYSKYAIEFPVKAIYI